MTVPLYDHARLYAATKQPIDAAIARVLTSGRLEWGPEVPAFEREFAAWVGATHAVSVGSGTAGLKAALLALGVGAGDEVITVPNTDIAGSSAIRFAGARVVWVDVDPATRCMDPDAAAAAITPRTKAILPVDLYGHPAALTALRALADLHGMALVEDACLALGAEIEGRRIGSLADITCFSFAPTKHLGAYGCGGACTTESTALMERLCRISAYGQSRERHSRTFAGGIAQLHHETDGLNERLDELQAAILRAKLPKLDHTLTQRRAQAARFAERLADSGLDLPMEHGPVRHGWRNYVIECDDRDGLRARLTAAGVGTNTPYAPPMHLQPVYADLGHRIGSFPAAERSCARLLGLPLGPHLELKDIDRASDAVLKAL
jgi:dTDP-4-amino-4,6-dideoxygalactose transaminase